MARYPEDFPKPLTSALHLFTTKTSHPSRYFTLAFLHFGGFTLTSHPRSVISDAQLTGIARFGSTTRSALRAHPAPISTTTPKTK
jgi:hypothetical protein